MWCLNNPFFEALISKYPGHMILWGNMENYPINIQITTPYLESWTTVGNKKHIAKRPEKKQWPRVDCSLNFAIIGIQDEHDFFFCFFFFYLSFRILPISCLARLNVRDFVIIFTRSAMDFCFTIWLREIKTSCYNILLLSLRYLKQLSIYACRCFVD